jgi:hypothetical protein
MGYYRLSMGYYRLSMGYYRLSMEVLQYYSNYNIYKLYSFAMEHYDIYDNYSSFQDLLMEAQVEYMGRLKQGFNWVSSAPVHRTEKGSILFWDYMAEASCSAGSFRVLSHVINTPPNRLYRALRSAA